MTLKDRVISKNEHIPSWVGTEEDPLSSAVKKFNENIKKLIESGELTEKEKKENNERLKKERPIDYFSPKGDYNRLFDKPKQKSP